MPEVGRIKASCSQSLCSEKNAKSGSSGCVPGGRDSSGRESISVFKGRGGIKEQHCVI